VFRIFVTLDINSKKSTTWWDESDPANENEIIALPRKKEGEGL